MPIYPLPQFEADLEADRRAYEALKPPRSVVVRFGRMRMIGEFPYDGNAKPGCGSKLVVRTYRGTELGEMLTSTCPNSGCSKSVSRQEMLRYIENSGGRDYPFTTEGRVLRVATKEDLDRQAALEQDANRIRAEARRIVESMGLPMKIVEAEPILGGERLTLYYMSEERVDFRELVRVLGQEFRTRIDLRQVGARDEARLVADYERCGQYCCCKNFLKVLKPVSMRSAKVQKATLDPLKISGRCGRLMCCLRYEDQTYEELRKRLPRKKTRVGTPEGDGIVLDGQILTQLVLVQLEAEDRQIAVAVEELTEPKGPAAAKAPVAKTPIAKAPAPSGEPGRGARRGAPSGRPPGPPQARPERPVERRPVRDEVPGLDELDGDELPEKPADAQAAGGAPPPRPPESPGAAARRRRRRRRGRRPPGGGPPPPPPQAG